MYETILQQLITEPASTYHGRRGECLSSHLLADFRACPYVFRVNEIETTGNDDNDDYRFGRAVHACALEGEQEYLQQFLIGGPINPRTQKPYGRDTQAFAKWEAEQPPGRDFVTAAEDQRVRRIASKIQAHELAAELLQAGRPEGVARVRYEGMRCQIRCDWFSPDHGLVDLKTCNDIDWFEYDATKKYHYIHQMAFYRAMLKELSGMTVPVHLIACEKNYPYRVGVWLIDDGALDDAATDNHQAILRLKHCRQTDTWPTGYEHLRVLTN